MHSVIAAYMSKGGELTKRHADSAKKNLSAQISCAIWKEPATATAQQHLFIPETTKTAGSHRGSPHFHHQTTRIMHMNMLRLIFSPTGGTKRAADALSTTWSTRGIRVRDIDLTDPSERLDELSLDKDDSVLIALPAYGGRVPGLAAQRLSHLKGNGAACVLLCTYGNRAFEDTLVEMADLAEKQGLKVIAAVTSVTEHSIVRLVAAGRPDAQDVSELASYGQRLCEKLLAEDRSMPEIPGSRPYKPLGSMKLVPLPDDSCNHCGLCAESCPAQAIDPETLETDADACICCMRCVQVCPQGSRRPDPAMMDFLSQKLEPLRSVRHPNELYL